MLGKRTSNRGRNPLVWLAPEGPRGTVGQFECLCGTLVVSHGRGGPDRAHLQRLLGSSKCFIGPQLIVTIQWLLGIGLFDWHWMFVEGKVS